jgi:hypothetical protein
MRTVDPERSSLWTLLAAPAIWAVHFLFSYVAAAVYCEKAVGGLGPVRMAIGVATVMALAAIFAVGFHALHQWGFGERASPPHDDDTDEDRARFLGHATVLLCGLSIVATAYVALVALFFDTCG